MDAQQFLAEFGYIANAPGGVARLRELVLSLAVQSRLASQDELEEPAQFLLERIQDLKNPTGKNKQATLSRPTVQTDQPHQLPRSWRWARCEDYFLELCTGPFGSMIHREDYVVGGVPLINPSHMVSGKIVHDPAVSVSQQDAQRLVAYALSKGDLLFARRGEVGRYAVVEEEQQGWLCGTGSFFAKLSPECNRQYLGLVFRESGFRRRLLGESVGSTMTNLNQRVLLDALIPIPPLNEQCRIVAKVDELMALCDKLEAQQKDRRKLQNALRQSTLQALASAESPRELQDGWQRLQANFGHLFTEPEDTRDLEQCIKQLALKGLLTLGNPSLAISADLARKTSTPAAVRSPEEDWSIPKHWIWTRCAWLGEARLGKMLDASKNKGELRPYLRNINVRWHHFDLTDVLRMRVEEHELSRVTIKRGDLVICEGGEPGRAAIWDRDEEFLIQKALHRFRCGPDLLPEYLLLCLEHDFFSGRLARYYTGATIKHLTGKALAAYPIPLPSISEQRQILSVAGALSSVVASLRDELSRSKRWAELLSTAAVAALTGITTDQEQEAPVKAPQTELIAPVRLGTPPDVKAHAPLATLLARHNGEMSARDLWQRFGGEIDAFYAQLKTEVAHGWIAEPAGAEVREKPVETAGD